MKSELREKITKKLHDSGCSFVEVRQTATAADIALEEAAKIAESMAIPGHSVQAPSCMEIAKKIRELI